MSNLLNFATTATLVESFATNLTANQIPYSDGTNLAGTSNLTFDNGTGALTVSGAVTGSNLSGTNTGDQTITLTGDVTGSGTGSFAATISSDSVTYDKMQDTSTTDVLLGRSTAGAGTVEEIACTSAGRALLDDATAAAQATTLGLGTGDTPAFSGVSLDGGFLNIGTATTLTISGGVVTATQSHHKITGEGGAADDLNTINGGTEGDILVLRSLASAIDITLKNGTGNLQIGADFVLNNVLDTITLMYAGSVWLRLSNANNGA